MRICKRKAFFVQGSVLIVNFGKFSIKSLSVFFYNFELARIVKRWCIHCWFWIYLCLPGLLNFKYFFVIIFCYYLYNLVLFSLLVVCDDYLFIFNSSRSIRVGCRSRENECRNYLLLIFSLVIFVFLLNSIHFLHY